ncbi:MAG: peptidoglycan editing factor PgeF [Granulosicoccaceae bacterium]
MTLRTGGQSAAPFQSNNLGVYVGDSQAACNRAQLKYALQLPSEPLWLKQVHGTNCLDAADLENEAQADAIWTDTPGRVLAIQTADCLPVLFADAEATVVAAAHAGWRGLLNGVLENTLEAMPVDSPKVHCWLGAAIGPCCFEVGDEVRQAFVDRDAQDEVAFQALPNKKWLADLYQLSKRRLKMAGVTQVHGGGLCTACDDQQFFSYRRDQGQTGRMASLIWLLGE